MNLKKSINIKYDLKDESLLSGYYATKSHIEVINNVVKGISNQNSRSHITYGPYGAGKSYVSTILANLLEQNYEQILIDELSDKYSLIDSEISIKLKQSNNQKIKYLAVTLNGYEQDFQEAIYSSIKKVLFDNEIEIKPKGTSKIVNDIVAKWSANFPEVLDKFIIFVKECTFDNLDLFYDALNFNDDVLIKFSKFYESVSAGARLSLYSASDFESSILEISDQLSLKNLGLFIVYDEFGRFLQSINESKISVFFGQLQNLAELVNKSENLTLLLVSHKPINYYFKNLPNDIRLEYSKIEKRFTSCEIKSDETTFISIALQVISEVRSNNVDISDIESFINGIYKYSIFNGNYLGNIDISKFVNNCFPLHPVTLMLLPKFSQIFGQNERTLFTFLYDESKFGLKGYIHKHKGFYHPDNLVDYFFNSNDDRYNDNYKDVVLFKKLINQLSNVVSKEFLEKSKRILKFILIWNITNSNSANSISNGLISYSLNIDLELVNRIIDQLIIGKLIRKNLIHKNLELIEASSADIETEILKNELILSQKINLENKIINEYNPYKVIYSREYNYKFDTVRFCLVHLDLSGEENTIFDKNFDLLTLIQVRDYLDYEINSKYIIGKLQFPIKDLKKKALRLASIDLLLSDKHYTSEYKNVDIDLQYEKDIVLNNLRDFYNLLFSNETNFYFNSNKLEIFSKGDFESFIDKLMFRKFNRPLIIHNDQLNMFVIQKPQVNALIEIIGKMIKSYSNVINYSEEDNSAEAFAYYAIKSSNINEVSEIIKEHMILNENGKVSDILNIIQSEPFGIRPTLTSIIFVYSVINMWKNIMFFNNGEYIANLPSDYIYNIGLGKFDCVYNYSDFDFRNREYLEDIIRLFGDHSEGTESKSLGIQALSSLYNWFLSLPVLTQLGYINKEEEKQFIKLLEISKHNPKNALQNLSKNYDIESLSRLKNEIESIFIKYLDKVDLDLRTELGMKSWKDWSSKLSDNIQRTNKLARISLTSKNFITDYAKEFEQLEINKWPKSMFEVLKTQIRNEYDTIVDKIQTIEVIINNKVINVADIELSTRANNLMNNLSSQVIANTKYMTREEVEKILISLLQKFIK